MEQVEEAPDLQEIPTVPGHWLLGNLIEFKRAPHEFLCEASRHGQGLVQFRLFHKKMIAITSPKCAQVLFKIGSKNYPRGPQRKSLESILGLGLITQEGRLWKHHRRVVAQAFRPDFLEYSFEQNSRLVSELIGQWQGIVDGQSTVDVVDETRKITLSVIVRALFSIDIDLEKNRDLYSAIVSANHLMFTRHTSLINFPDWVPTPLNRKIANTRRVMDEFISSQLAVKEETRNEATQSGSEIDSNDIVDHLLQAEAAGDIDRQQIYDEIRTLLVAGFETTATSLAWTLYLLAKHPQIVVQWQQELDSVLEGGLPKWEHISRLPLTEYIVMEGLRLYPPAYGLTRTSLEEDAVAGYKMPANASIVLSIYGIQHDANYWDEPEEFDPSRFSREWREDAFLPFGMGKHICIGSRFSILESMLVLSSIGQRFDISLAEDVSVPANAQVTLMPGAEIKVKIKARS